MPAISYRGLKKMQESMGSAQMVRHLRQHLQEGNLSASDFSIRDLFTTFFGQEGLSVIRDSFESGKPVSLMEFGGIAGVDPTAFSNITGQLVISKVMEGYKSPEFELTNLVSKTQTNIKDSEIIPGIQDVGDVAEVIQPNDPYPYAGFGENYHTVPAKEKRGRIVGVTKEAILFDLTGQVLKQAQDVGHILGLNREKRVADVILGVTNPHNWLGNALNTYYDTATSAVAAAATGLTIWVNIHTNPLVDWTDVDAAEQLFARMRDPFTNEPIVIGGNKTLLVMPQLKHVARMVVNSTEVRRDNTTQRTAPVNPLDPYPVIASEFLYSRALAAGWTTPQNCWWLGDFKAAFDVYYNWDITVSEAPSNSEAEFNQDIVARYKASVRDVVAVDEPRKVVRSCRSCDTSSSSGEVPR